MSDGLSEVVGGDVDPYDVPLHGADFSGAENPEQFKKGLEEVAEVMMGADGTTDAIKAHQEVSVGEVLEKVQREVADRLDKDKNPMDVTMGDLDKVIDNDA